MQIEILPNYLVTVWIFLPSFPFIFIDILKKL